MRVDSSADAHKKDDARFVLYLFHGHGVDDANASRSIPGFIIEHLGNHAIGPQCHMSGGLGHWQRRVERAEVRTRRATTVTRPTVMTRGAAVV